MRRPAWHALAILAPLCAAVPAPAVGPDLFLDPGAPFIKYTHNTNDGYDAGRGMVFRADEAIIVNGAAFYNEDDEGLFATFALYSVVNTSGDVLAGATLLRSVNAVIAVGELQWYGVKFPEVQLVPNQNYLLRISYPDISEQNWYYNFDPLVFGSAPVDIGPVTLIDGEAGGSTSNFVAPPLALQLKEVNVFLDPVQFQQAVDAAGKLSKSAWNFEPHDLLPGSIVALDEPLAINTHALDADDPWTTAAGANLWPPTLDNVQFVSNTTPQGPLTPHGADGLAFAAAGFQGLTNDALVADFFVDSFDIISGPPSGSNHTAIAFQLTAVFHPGGLVHITVYDKQDQELTKVDVNLPPTPAKVFVGILRKNGETIGRIDIWSPNNSAEGISSIALYRDDPCPWDCGNGDGTIGVVDFLALLGQWGLVGTPCDFNGNGVGVTDFLKLLGNWGPCPSQASCVPQACGTYAPGCDPTNGDCICTRTFAGNGFCIPASTGCGPPCPAGVCPAGFVCVVDTCCGGNVCVPATLTCPGAPVAAPPAGTLTVSGIAPGPPPNEVTPIIANDPGAVSGAAPPGK